MKLKPLLIIAMLILSLLTVMACSSESNSDSEGGQTSGELSTYDDTGFAMGTVVNQTIYTHGDNPASEIIDLLTEVESKWISWRVEDSDIGKINKSAGSGNAVDISEETSHYIESALNVATDSKGAFDPTVGKLTRLWDFDGESQTVPEDSKIQKLVEDVDYKKIKLKGNSVTLEDDSSIDLGAIGKGIGCDEIEKYFEDKKDIKGALVNIGGSSIITYGSKDTEEPWKVAVLNPRDEQDYLGVINLDGTNHVSTSGDYEKYFESDGIRYFHILDPKTGYPADSGLMSVTVVTNDGAYCDALSTACFVSGIDKSAELLEKYEAEAIFVDTDKNVHVTDGLKDKFELLAEGYTVKE